jgi:hypothetical protein
VCSKTSKCADEFGDYRFHGPQGEGAMRALREVKREDAERRNAATPKERRRRTRRQKAKAR